MWLLRLSLHNTIQYVIFYSRYWRNLGSPKQAAVIESRYLLTYFPCKTLCCIVRWFVEYMNKISFRKDMKVRWETLHLVLKNILRYKNKTFMTRSLAVAKRPCHCYVDQFWPYITGRLYFADIIGLFSTNVT